MSWADRYIGREFVDPEEDGVQGDPFRCWEIVHDVFLNECGIEIDTFAGVRSGDRARIHELVMAAIASNDWIKVERSAARAFDVAVMWVIKRLSGRETVRTLSHLGIVTAPNRLLHIERETRSVCVRFSNPSVAWRLHSFYRHRSFGA